jgi:hypothetical protein
MHSGSMTCRFSLATVRISDREPRHPFLYALPFNGSSRLSERGVHGAAAPQGAREMKFLRRILSDRDSTCMATTMERRRFAAAMPGQIGAVKAARLGHSLA